MKRLSILLVLLLSMTAAARAAQAELPRPAGTLRPQVADKPSPAAQPQVVVRRLPAGALQPQVTVDAKGHPHLLYFVGDPHGGDLMYVPLDTEGQLAAKPARVNSQPHCATAMGGIRGGQLALGPDNSVHVVWNCVDPSGDKHMSVAYSRSTGRGFTPQVDLMKTTAGLDGGCSVAVDKWKRVYVAWHAHAVAGPDEDKDCGVFLTRSEDGGKSFPPERRISLGYMGACSCCGMRMSVAPDGSVTIVYRTARDNHGRNVDALTSNNGVEFQESVIDQWDSTVCPVSGFALDADDEESVAAFEHDHSVVVALMSRAGDMAQQVPPPTQGSAKCPTLATGPGGILLVWAEKTSYSGAGQVAWTIYNEEGKPTAVQRSSAGPLPSFSFPAAWSRPDGSFVILY